MRVIKEYNGKWEYCEYPRHDMQPVDSTIEGVQFYLVKEEERPEYDSARGSMKQKELVLTNETDNENPHFKIAVKGWEVVSFTQDQIIQRLNDSLGQHLDSNYPLWQRQKHTDELNMMHSSPERIAEISALKTWEFECRAERDKREQEYINTNQFPSFEWEPKPEKK
jgi:hypothetical protein